MSELLDFQNAIDNMNSNTPKKETYEAPIFDWRGTAKVLADYNLYQSVKDHQAELVNMEKTIAEKNIENQNFFENIYNSYKQARIGSDVSELWDDRRKAEEIGDFVSIENIDKKIEKAEQNSSKYAVSKDSYWGKGLGTVAGSMSPSEYAVLAGEIVLTAVLMGLAPTTGGATGVGAAVTAGRAALKLNKIRTALSRVGASKKVIGAIGGAAQAGTVFGMTQPKSRGEAFQSLTEANPDMPFEVRNEAAKIGGDLSAAVEAAGTTLGVGGVFSSVAKKTITKLLGKEAGQTLLQKAIGKAALSEAGKKIAERALGVAGVAGGLGASAIAEGSEEILQDSIVTAITKMAEENEMMSYLSAGIGGYKEMAKTAKNWYNDTMDEDDYRRMESFKVAFAGSLLLGGAITGAGTAVGKVGSVHANKNIAEQQDKYENILKGLKESSTNSEHTANIKAMLDNSPFKDEDNKAILNNIALGRDEKIAFFIPKNVALDMINRGKEDEELALINTNIKLAESINNSLDDMVEISLADGVEIFKNEKLFSMLQDHIVWDAKSMSKYAMDMELKDIIETLPKFEERLQDAETADAKLYNTLITAKGHNEDVARYEVALANIMSTVLSDVNKGKVSAEDIMKNVAGMVTVEGKGVEDATKYGEQLKSLLNITEPTIADRLKSFIGINSNLTPAIEKNRMKALSMENKYTPEEIRKKTGWSKGPDGKWRYEKSNKNDKIKTDFINKNISKKQSFKLGDIFDSVVFQFYPTIKDEVDVIFTNDLEPGNASTLYGTDGVTIKVSMKDKDSTELKKTLLHEIAHVIQHKEDWALGGSPAFMAATKYTQEEIEYLKRITEKGRECLLMITQKLSKNMDAFIEWSTDSKVLDDGKLSEPISFGDVKINNVKDLLKLIKEKVVNIVPLQNNNDIKDIMSRDFPEFWTYYSQFITDEMNENIDKWSKPINNLLDEWGSILEEGAEKMFDTQPYQLYKRLFGEVEARNVEARSEFTEEEIMETPIISTQDIQDENKYLIRVGTDVVPYKPELFNFTEAGSFDPQTFIINLTESTNPATFAHEFMHFSMTAMINSYQQGNISAYWKKQLNAVFKDQGIIDGKFESQEQYTKFMEYMSEAFTTYMKDGRAEVRDEYKNIFNKLKEWFVKVYEMIKGMPKVKLTSAVTNFYDAIFEREVEIQSNMEKEKIGVLERPEYVTDDQWNTYENLKNEARGACTYRVIQNAKKLADIKTTKEYQDKLAEQNAIILADMMQDKAYKLMAMLYGDGLKIREYSLVNLSPNVAFEKEQFLTKKGGEDADTLAKDYGFENVTDMVAFINNHESPEVEAMQAAEIAVQEWYGNNNPELIELQIPYAMKNLAMLKVMLYESMMLKGEPLETFNAKFNAMVSSADETFANWKLLSAVNVDETYQRFLRLANKYATAIAANADRSTLGDIRYDMVLESYAIMRQKALASQNKKFSKHFKKYRSHADRTDLRELDGAAWDILTAVMKTWGLSTKSPVNSVPVAERIKNYIDTVRGEIFIDETIIDDNLFFLSNPNGKTNKDITVEDFIKLDSQMRIFEAIAKELKGSRKRELTAAINEGAADLAKKIIDNNMSLDKIKGLGTIRMDVLLDKVLPESLLQKIKRPFVNSIYAAQNWARNKQDTLTKLLSPIEEHLNKNYKIGNITLTMKEWLVVVLNCGNEHNTNCLILTLQEKFNNPEFGYDQLQAIVQELCDTKPFGVDIASVAQSVWDELEKTAKDLLAVQSALGSTELELVEAKGIIDNFKGGFYPANNTKKDKVFNLEDLQNMNSMKNALGFPEKSVQKNRTSVHSGIALDLSQLNLWCQQMATVLNIAVPYNNMAAMVNNDNIKTILGSDFIKEVNSWMKEALFPERMNQLVAQTLSVASKVSATFALGLKLQSVPQQLAGIIVSAAENGVANTITHALPVLSNPVMLFNIISECRKLSVYMNNRFANSYENISGFERSGVSANKYVKGLEKAHDKLTETAMLPLVYGDAIASYITWTAAYDKAIKEGMTKSNAALKADSIVSSTQGDSNVVSRPAISRGSLKYLNPFMSYFIGIYSAWRSTLIAGEKTHAVSIFIAAAALTPIFETLSTTSYLWATASDDDKKRWKREKIRSYEDFVLAKIKSNIASSAGATMLPYFGLLSDTIEYAITGKEYDQSIPVLTIMQDAIKMPVDLKNYIFSEGKEAEKAGKKALKRALSVVGVNPRNVERYANAWRNLINGN